MPNKKYIAKIISYLFIPPAMNLFIFLLYSNRYDNGQKGIAVILSALIFGFILPIVTFIILRKKGKVIDNDATIKEERTVPYLYGIGFSLLAILFLHISKTSSQSIILWEAYLINSIVLVIVNKYWKISAHAMGAAIPLGAAMLLNNIWIAIFFIILLLVGWSRYKLKVHTLPQIIGGSFVGYAITYFLLCV